MEVNTLQRVDFYYKNSILFTGFANYDFYLTHDATISYKSKTYEIISMFHITGGSIEVNLGDIVSDINLEIDFKEMR